MTEEFLTPEHWLELLLVNVNNGAMDDGTFREFVRHNLPTVIGHGRLRHGLVERGRLPGEQEIEVLAAGFQEGSGDFRDRDSEPFHKK